MRRVDVLLLRGPSTEQGTFGRLYCEGWCCATLELPWRDNKVNESCIPSGEYHMDIVTTGRLHSGRAQSYLIEDVPDRSGILIHSGNYAGDRSRGFKAHSWGCILLGRARAELSGQQAVLSSRPTVWTFMDNIIAGRPGRLKIAEARR